MPTRPRQILIVDDNLEDRVLYQRFLQQHAECIYAFVEAASGAEGLALCQTMPPDCILLDYSLPDLDGLEFLAVLGGETHVLSVPVVMLTGHGNEHVAIQAMKSGAQDYLVKGRLTPQALQRAVDSAMEKVELQRAEAALRASEARHAAILEAAIDGIITIDQAGTILEFNTAAERLFGLPRTAAVGQPLAEFLIPPAFRERHRRGLAHYLATGEGPVLGQRVEMLGLRADGTEFPIELSIVRVGAEQPVLFTGFVRDLSERKRAEAALQAQSE